VYEGSSSQAAGTLGIKHSLSSTLYNSSDLSVNASETQISLTRTSYKIYVQSRAKKLVWDGPLTLASALEWAQSELAPESPQAAGDSSQAAYLMALTMSAAGQQLS
jgi:hypothetical protein